MMTSFTNFENILVLGTIVAQVKSHFFHFAFILITLKLTLMFFFLQLIGLAIFTLEWPNPFPDVFGYHELFHCFVVIAGCCVYFCNWSIVRRIAGQSLE